METHERFLWLRKHKHIPVLLLIGLLWVQIIWQLFYPYDTALPRAELSGKQVAGQTRLALAAKIEKQFQAESITIATSSTSYETPLASVGAAVNSESMAKQLTDYPLWQRAVPFSSLWLQPHVARYSVSYNVATLAASASVIAKELSALPVNAALTITDGKLVATEAKDGQAVAEKDIIAAIKAHTFSPKKAKVVVRSAVAKPAIADESIAPVREEAEAKIARSYILRMPSGKEYSPSQKTIASWLTLKKSDTSLSLKLNSKKIDAYIASINNKVAIAATASQVTLRDGKEVGRTAGKAGSAVASSDLRIKLTNALNSNETGVVMDVLLVPVAPGAVYSRSYSSSQAGLNAYVQYVTSSENVRIALQQVGGKGWSATGRASESTPSASTYKLFVALWLFDQMNKDKIEWSDPWLDTTVSVLFRPYDHCQHQPMRGSLAR